MNFDLTEEQDLFMSTVEKFTASIDFAARNALRANVGGYDRVRWRTLAELGLIALAVDEDSGGIGGSLVDLMVVAETLGKGNSPDPWIENGVLPARLLAAGGANVALAAVLDGSQIAAFAFAEHSFGYSLSPQNVIAKAADDGTYLLSGKKTFVLGGAIADLLIISADCDGTAGLFVVPADIDGIQRRDYRVADGSMAAEIEIHNVSVAGDTRLNLGADSFDDVIAEVRLLASAEIVGLAQRCLDDTLTYVKQREQFGVPISTFQVIQHRLVDCYSAFELARSMLLRTALSARNGKPEWRAEVCGAKYFIGQNANMIARDAVQMHGGMGITDELATGHAMKRISLLMRLFGHSVTDPASSLEAA